MATITAAAGGGNWATGATWVGGSAPGAGDDARLDATSGNVTIATGGGTVCRSLDCTGYTGTLTHNSSTTLTIGDGTAGAGNIAFKLVAGMTYICLGSSTLSFVSTSATQQTIDFGGKSSGTHIYNGAGGSWIFQSAVTALASITLTAGSLDTNGQTVQATALLSTNSNTRSLSLGASSLTLTAVTPWDTTTTTGLTFNAGTSTITANSSNATINSGTLTFYNLTLPGTNTASLPASNCTFNNLTRTGTAIKTDILSLRANYVVNGTFTANGNSAVNRLLVQSNTVNTQRTITAAVVSASNADFMDIVGAGAGSWSLAAITGNSGDCGGNSGITFTSPATQTWSGTSGGNWSANAWSGRVPLPQDDAVINAAFSASQTVTQDMPRAAKSINFTGSTGGVTFSPSLSYTVYGSLNFTNLGTLAAGGGSTWTFGGRSASYTITTGGKSITQILQFSAPGATYTLQDAVTTAGQINITLGTLNTNSQTVTCPNFAANGTGSGANLGASTLNLTSTGAITIFSISNASTLSSTTPTINVVNASANARTITNNTPAGFAGATINYTVAGSTGSLTFGTYGYTIDTLNFSDASNARTLSFTNGQTHTFRIFNVQGSTNGLMTVNSASSGSAATFSKPYGVVSCDYLSVKDITATGGASWYAGTNSVNVSGNSGWFFTVPVIGSFMSFI